MTRLRIVLLLLVIPAALLGKIIWEVDSFLPWMPAGLQPLASEYPDEAARAFRDANWVEGDRVFPVLTDQMAMAEELARGRFPSWEPYFGLGTPLFAGSIAGAAYPPNWLGFVMPPEEAAGPLALLSLFLAGLGMWLFLRRLGLSPHARLVGVLAFQLGGWGISNLYYYMKVDAALWLPWSLWAIEGLLARRRWSGLVLTLTTAASLVSGFVTVALFCLAFAALYGAVRLLFPSGWLDPRFGPGPETESDPSKLRPALLLAVFLGLGITTASVQLFPSFESSRQSLRIDRTPGDLVDESLPLATLAGTMVPDLFGAPTEITPPGRLPVAWWLTPADEFLKAEVANPLEWNTYAGAICVLLALVGLVAAPRRAALPFLGLVLVIGYSQGWWWLRWMYALPGLNIGAPARVAAVAWCLWPWLAAVGAASLIEARPRASVCLIGASFAVGVISFVLWSNADPASWAASLERTLFERYGEAYGQTLEDIRARVSPESALAAGERLERLYAQLFAASLSAFAASVAVLVLRRPLPHFAGRVNPVATWTAVAAVIFFALAPIAEWSVPANLRTPSTLAAVVAAALLALGTWTRRRRREPAVCMPLLAALAMEGILAANGHITSRPAEPYGAFPPSESIEAVREAAGRGRVVRYDPTPTGVEHVVNLARPNMLEPYGIGDITPYTVFTPRTLVQLFADLDPNTRYRSGISSVQRFADLAHPLLDLLCVSAVISRDPLEHPRLRPVREEPGFCVYAREGALPPARIVSRVVRAVDEVTGRQTILSGVVDFDETTLLISADEIEPAYRGAPADFRPGQIELVERPSRDRFNVEVWGSSGGWLVMHEQFYPGWQAKVNGEPAEIVRADTTYRAVRIPPGDCRVETWYAPASIFWGLVLSVLSPFAAAFLTRRYAGGVADA